jgi:hypothetical protein
MFDNATSNKYFIIALIIALIVVLYLYSQKKSCDIENMDTIVDRPWANDDESQYRSVKSDNSKNRLKRRDEIFIEYTESTSDNDTTPVKKRKAPKPMDNHPELAQCPPCICPGDKKKSKKRKSNKTK